tara:strand:- start:326 stop:505 length:180 start_codon:yes stop_codon:yes gene_type:complete
MKKGDLVEYHLDGDKDAGWRGIIVGKKEAYEGKAAWKVLTSDGVVVLYFESNLNVVKIK